MAGISTASPFLSRAPFDDMRNCSGGSAGPVAIPRTPKASFTKTNPIGASPTNTERPHKTSSDVTLAERARSARWRSFRALAIDATRWHRLPVPELERRADLAPELRLGGAPYRDAPATNVATI
jgi:hypothetical protein